MLLARFAHPFFAYLGSVIFGTLILQQIAAGRIGGTPRRPEPFATRRDTPLAYWSIVTFEVVCFVSSIAAAAQVR
jgi:hypothetical protein